MIAGWLAAEMQVEERLIVSYTTDTPYQDSHIGSNAPVKGDERT